MTRVALIAHAGKSFGGGLTELRGELRRQGIGDPLWIEVAKSRHVPKQVRRAFLFVLSGLRACLFLRTTGSSLLL